jgi:Domain of unknown function (DUF4055)
MLVTNAAQDVIKTVADPNAVYESLTGVWKRSRAICSGERFAKNYDNVLDFVHYSNLLIPFSNSMTQKQYNFFKAEAELPGITAQFRNMIVGGLLRKPPAVSLPEDAPKEAQNWILNEFGKDDVPLVNFLKMALDEELETSRAWVFVDYPVVENPEKHTPKELQEEYKPFPCIYKAENVINWRVREDYDGKTILDRVIVRGLTESYEKNEFHATLIDTVWVHELDKDGDYVIRKFVKRAPVTSVTVNAGQTNVPVNKEFFEEVKEEETYVEYHGEHLKFIPAWPLNGCVEPHTPILTPFIDKEVALYNKISRRNHLLYGAATYTPYIKSSMDETRFKAIVDRGLGCWFQLEPGDEAAVLETPVEALKYMEAAIAAGIEEMAKLGIRMLAPETGDQSGVALEIRNAAQTAQLGSLNHQVSNTFKCIIAFMVNWRYGTELKPSDVVFSLSEDFNPLPVGADWMRLATEWYDVGKIPRSVWLSLLRRNDIVSADYDDEKGKKEIIEDMETLTAKSDAEAERDATYQEKLNKSKLKAVK